MNEGLNKLAQVLNNRTQSIQQAYSELLLDFGQIQQDYSLLTNTYPIPIPKSDYLVLRQLTLGSVGTILTTTTQEGTHEHSGTGSHEHENGAHEGHESGDGKHTHLGGNHSHGQAGGHTHNVTIPEKMRSIRPGDHVLVAWVQNDAVVLDIIVNAADIS